MEFKGIYYSEEGVYFVNSFTDKIVNVSTVRTNSLGGMTKVLDDTKEISVEIFKDFKFSGAYTRGEINDY